MFWVKLVKKLLSYQEAQIKHRESHEKEKGDWVKEGSWMEEVQEYGLYKFHVEWPIPRLDDKILYVIKDCIEWRNKVITQCVFEIKELLNGMEILDDIIQGYLKWIDK